MKMLRFRFRNVVGLGVLLTVAILLLSLPPSARSPRLLLDGFTHFSAPTHQPLALVQADAGPRDLPEHIQMLPQPGTTVKVTTVKEKSRAKDNTTEVIVAKVTTAPNKSRSESNTPTVSPEPKKSEEKAEKDEVPNNDVENESDAFVQDFTPADFVEVKKIKPVTSKTKAELKHKKPAVLNHSRGSESTSPSSKYTPQWLKDRALTFSNSSVSLYIYVC